MNEIITWAKHNPVPAGLGIAVLGIGVLYFMGFFSGGSSQGDPAAAAYYAAQSAQAQAGDALQATQITSNAATAQDLINASANVQNNNTWANVDLQQTQSNNSAAMSLAPFATEDNLISTLGQVASLPGTTTTSQSGSSGFFGIGASSKTTTSTTPNPAALNASQLLTELTTGLYAGH